MRGHDRIQADLRAQLLNVALLLRNAVREVEAAARESADPPAAQAIRSLNRARVRLSRAACAPAFGWRPDGQPTVFTEVAAAGVAAAVAGLAAHVYADVVPAVVTVVVFVPVVVVVEWWLRLVASRLGTKIRYLALPYDWPLLKFDVEVSASGDISASLAMIAQARHAIGLVVSDRLRAIADFPRSGTGLLGAAERDTVLGNLRLTDLELCYGSDALERWREGVASED